MEKSNQEREVRGLSYITIELFLYLLLQKHELYHKMSQFYA